MSWVMAAVTVGTAAYGAYSKKKSAEDAQQMAMAGAGRVPEAAEYEAIDLVPVDFQQVQRDSILGNQDMAGMIAQLLSSTAQTNRGISRGRADAFGGNLWNNIGTQADTAARYLAGEPSWSDAMETVARSTGLNGAVGTPGTGAALTARDLGLLDMDLRQRGAAMNQSAIGQAEALHPRALDGSVQDYQITPSQAVPWKINENLSLTNLALAQAANEYTAEQSANNIRAGADPRVTAALPYMSYQSSAGNQAAQSVDWNQLIQQIRQSQTGYRNYSDAQKAAPYAAGFSVTEQGRYVPKARVVS